MLAFDFPGSVIGLFIMAFVVIGQLVAAVRKAQARQAPRSAAAAAPAVVRPPAAAAAAAAYSRASYPPPSRPYAPPPPSPPPSAVLPVARPLALFADAGQARQAIILAEVLAPPVALRTTSPTRNAF